MTVNQIYILKNEEQTEDTGMLLDDICSLFDNVMVVDDASDVLENIDENTAFIRIHEEIGPRYILIDTKNKQVVFKIINYKTRRSMGTNEKTTNKSQLILSNFNTELGVKVAEIFMDLFPMDLDANKVINCSVHKDFIYFRMFKFVLSLSEKKLKNTKTRMNEIGPQMTLRLYRFTEEVEGKKAVKHYKKYIKNRNLL